MSAHSLLNELGQAYVSGAAILEPPDPGDAIKLLGKSHAVVDLPEGSYGLPLAARGVNLAVFAAGAVTLADSTGTVSTMLDGEMAVLISAGDGTWKVVGEVNSMSQELTLESLGGQPAAAAPTFDNAPIVKDYYDAYGASERRRMLVDHGDYLIASDEIKLGTQAALLGLGFEKSVLKAFSGATGRMVQTVDLDDCLADEPKWSDGNGGLLAIPPMRVRAAHIGFHGSGSNHDAPHENGAIDRDLGLTYDLTGLDAYSPGIFCQGLQFYKIHGTALRFNHGQVGTRPIPRPYIDRELCDFQDIFILNCLRGLHIQSGTDAVIDNVEVGGCRDEGILIEAGASVWDHVHTYGNGVGVQCNNTANFGTLQVDGDIIGFNLGTQAAYTTIDKLLMLHCYSIGADFQSSVEIGMTRVQAIPDGATGFKFRGNGGGAIYGGRTDITGNAAIGFDVRQDRVDVTQRIFGNVAKTGANAQTAMIFGEGVSISGCNINLQIDGCNKGLDLRAIGFGNTIKIRYKNVANPVVSGLGSMDASNHITLVNIADGTETTWTPS